jgi:iron complex outermembrane receptor protein
VTCNATFKTLVDPRSVRSVKGNVLAQSPKNKIALNARYTFEFEDGSTLVPALSYSWRDKFYNTFFNRPEEESPAYDNLDARMTWYSPKGHFTVIGFVRNVMDKDQTTSISSGSFNTDLNDTFSTASFSLPRTYGAELQFHW